MQKISALTVVLLLYVSAYTQDCKTAMLTTRGMELEYHNTLPRFGMFGKRKDDDFDITTLIYQVTDVKDSGGITYSYIRQIGVAGTKDDYFTCRRNVVLACDGKNITLPVNFYEVDSIFLCDTYGPAYGKKQFYLVRDVAPATCTLPVTVAVQDTLPAYSYNYKQVINDLDKERMENFVSGRQSGASPYMKDWGTMNFTARKVIAKQRLTVLGGTFDCYKIMVTVTLGKRGTTYTEYYAPGTGIIKIEYATGATTELARVRKKFTVQ